MVNLKELKDLIALMNEHQLVEMELEREGMKVRLRKAGAGGSGEGVVIERAVAHAPSASSAAATGPVPVPDAPPKEKGTEVKSPMVGTFYRAPAPEAPPFVQVDQQVEVGAVLCILEAMKLMNEIKSEVRGKITKICVENAQPVEFGHVLFLIEPN